MAGRRDLQRERDRLLAEIADAPDGRDRRRTQRRLAKRLALVSAAITQAATSDQAEVSDHAVLRYLERVAGLDLETVRAEILSEGREQMVRVLRTGSFPLKGGGRIIARNGVVVTVLGPGERA